VDFQDHPHISPVCLPDLHQDYSGRRCWVSGWGKDALGEEGAYQPVLKEVDVPVLSNRECEAALQETRLGQDFLLHPVTVSLPKTSLPRASSVPGARRARTRARVTVEGRLSVRSGGAGTLWALSAGESAVERLVEAPF